ncbi:acylphosphatase [Methylotetracoccus oryzae]|uniref:acylphosphatase n=1 Tax=Methylotetracoccus oryzae TaxID=1919059 RepID=UPI00111AFCD5|nr:acylphosphatase [Methylotetracoccus oryzae]
MTRRVRLIVSGRVQGVGFRAATARAAADRAIAGWVANRSDGSVEIEAQGEPQQLAQFITWCHRGPRWARVESVAIEELPSGVATEGFTIRQGYR